MYKSDIRFALDQLTLIPGGPVEGLIQFATVADGLIKSSLTEVVANNDAGIKAAVAQMNEALKPVSRRISEISPSMTAVELHALSARFDQVLSDYEELEPLLRPGRQALGGLSGAYDVALQRHSRPPALMALVEPATELGKSLRLYRELSKVHGTTAEESSGPEAIIELEEFELLSDFSVGLSMLNVLAKASSDTLHGMEEVGEGGVAFLPVTVASIESGSPIRITLAGGSKVISLMLSMVRDVFRVPYQTFTRHGRVIQAAETLARLRELKVTSPEVERTLQAAVAEASDQYFQSISSNRPTVYVDGERLLSEQPLALPSPPADDDGASGPPKLLGPSG